MTHIRCLVGFGSFTDPELMGTTGAVLKGLPGNKAFSNPPPELAQLQPAADDMTAAMAAQVHGGRAATAEKKKKRAALIAILRTLARYVEANCGNDEATLLSSGFSVVPAKGASSPLEKPTILSVKNGHGGELVATVRKTHRAQSYQAETSAVGPTGPGAWPRIGALNGVPHVSGAADCHSVASYVTFGRVYDDPVRARGGFKRETSAQRAEIQAKDKKFKRRWRSTAAGRECRCVRCYVNQARDSREAFWAGGGFKTLEWGFKRAGHPRAERRRASTT